MEDARAELMAQRNVIAAVDGRKGTKNQKLKTEQPLRNCLKRVISEMGNFEPCVQKNGTACK